jgi:hypothetical protein
MNLKRRQRINGLVIARNTGQRTRHAGSRLPEGRGVDDVEDETLSFLFRFRF